MVFELDFDRDSPNTTGLPFFTVRIFVFIPAISICFFTILAQSSIPSFWAETLGCLRSVRKSCRNRSLFFDMCSRDLFRLALVTIMTSLGRVDSFFYTSQYEADLASPSRLNRHSISGRVAISTLL